MIEPKGLANLGATCYINTTISCLAACPYFLNFILEKIKPDDNTLISELNIVLYEQYVNGNSVVPRKFMNVLKQCCEKDIEIYTQNDINEFLSIFIDKLNKCICRSITVGKKELVELYEYKNTSYDIQKFKMDMNWYEKNKKEYSSLLDIFYGQNISQIICGSCDHVHHNYEIYLNIMLPIESDSRTLDDCLKNYFNEETLNNNDEQNWKCDRCNKYSESKKTSKLWRNPKIMVISLKRFTYSLKKNNQNIDIPLHLNLNKYSLTNKSKYKLQSVAMHYGNLQGGHYYSVTLSSNNKWYSVDDLDVKQINDPDFNTYGYVFFYVLDDDRS